ncbi:chromate transporter [Flaviflagellibacter deserti]|uniref:Chromate transporter n=1 Tax=Flaviflagellibacter deserti TaxID=2267266 RepID=A0ABV9YZF3_9HYPH
MQDLDSSEASPEPPDLLNLFTGFLTISLIGFGGVLPWIRWLAVDRRKWMGPKEFSELLALCQFLPGGNIMNLAVIIGHRSRGPIGSVVSLTGLMVAPCTLVVGLGWLYTRYADYPGVADVLKGLGAAAAGLVIAMALRLLAGIGKEPVPLLFVAAGFVAVGLLRLPLVPTMLVLAPLSIAYSWTRVA